MLKLSREFFAKSKAKMRTVQAKTRQSNRRFLSAIVTSYSYEASLFSCHPNYEDLVSKFI